MMKNIYLSRYTSRETDCKGNRKPYLHIGCGGYLLLILLLTVLSLPAFPQTPRRTVTGTVTDQKTGKGVSYVTVKALSKADSLLSYAITAGDGAFTLAVDGRAKAVEFTLMGYETKRIGIRNMRQGMRVSLVPSGIMLKELTVKARPIERSKDTINYNVEAFKGKEDRYIEDVLKKLPGIEVAENGAISYQGKPINKFNIEGQDLLGNQYNQATRNLPADAVATVQVMENDQPIRALKDRVPSDKATLNIKLKHGYKLRPFGEASGGLGGFSDVLWNNRLTLINVERKNQLFLTARMNNNGENLAGDTEEHIDYSDIYNYEPLPPQMVQTGTAATPPVSKKRYLRNKSYTVGLNFLRRAWQYGSLRANLTYFGTSDRSEDSTYNYYGGSETLSLYEVNRLKMKKHTFMPRIRYELNAPNTYLTDELTGSLTFDRQTDNNSFSQASGMNAGGQETASRQPATGESHDSGNLTAGMLRESALRHSGYVQNKLRMTVNSGNNSYSINSLLRYFRRSESLGVTSTQSDSQSPYALTQQLSLERLMTRNSIGTRFYVGRNSLELQYAFELRSDNVALDGGKWFHTMYMKHTLSPEYMVKYSRGHITLDVPVNIFTPHLAWNNAASKTEFYVSPSVSWRHEFSPFWHMNVSGGFAHDESADVMTPETYYSSYRTRVLTADRIGWTRSTRASASLSYSNLITMFVWNFMAMASWRTADHYNEYEYGEQFTTVRPVWQDAKSRMFFVMTSADKTYTRAGLALKATLNYNRTTLPVAQNSVNAAITANVMAAALTLRWNKLAWLTLTERPTFNLTWQEPSAWSTGHNTLKSFYNIAGAHIFPIHGLDISLQWEYNMLEVEHGHYRHNSFLDATVRYAATKRLEFRLQLDNLLNRNTYEEASFSGLNYAYFSMPLRGREVMLHVAFSM